MASTRGDNMDCTYDHLRQDNAALHAVEDQLFAEQGGLCAYTGRSLKPAPARPPRQVNFHLEHLTPQTRCAYGQDADYTNLVACWPKPNCDFEPSYGARKKGDWPPPHEQDLFLSPLRHDCGARLAFKRDGTIAPQDPNDTAAIKTIQKLALDDPELTALRRAAIQRALAPQSRPLTLRQARALLVELQRDEDDLQHNLPASLLPFCFALRPALERELRKLEAIQQQRRSNRR
jgi:uncharacterized protein (TIGR02646 family)